MRSYTGVLDFHVLTAVNLFFFFMTVRFLGNFPYKLVLLLKLFLQIDNVLNQNTPSWKSGLCVWADALGNFTLNYGKILKPNGLVTGP